MRALFLYSLVSFGVGALMSLSMAPYNAWPLMLAGLAALYVLMARAETLKVTALLSFLFFYGYFSFGLSWVGNALLVEGNQYQWAYPLALLGAPILVTPAPVLACILIKRFFNLRTLGGVFGFSGALTIAEWVRGRFILDGFPWNNPAYAWADLLEIVQIIHLDNVYLLTVLSFFGAGAFGLFLLERTYRSAAPLLFGLVLFGGIFWYGAARMDANPTASNESVAVHIIQANIPQEHKWAPEYYEDNFARMVAMSRPDDATPPALYHYVFWPETSLMQRHLADPTKRYMLQSALRQYDGQASLIAGHLRSEGGNARFFNSTVMLDDTIYDTPALSNIYDKHHLVPFGEYIPLQRYIPIPVINRFPGFVAGGGPQSFEAPGGFTYSPLICYESIFPHESYDRSGEHPDFLLNVANDSWYGDSAGPAQHFVQGQFRAIETGIPFIRSTPTGISGVIDPIGRVLEKTLLFEEKKISLFLPEKINFLTFLFFCKGFIFLFISTSFVLFGLLPRLALILPYCFSGK